MDHPRPLTDEDLAWLEFIGGQVLAPSPAPTARTWLREVRMVRAELRAASFPSPLLTAMAFVAGYHKGVRLARQELTGGA